MSFDIEQTRQVLEIIPWPTVLLFNDKAVCGNEEAERLFSALPGENVIVKIPQEAVQTVRSSKGGNSLSTGCYISGCNWDISTATLGEVILLVFKRPEKRTDSSSLADLGRHIRMPLSSIMSAFSVLTSQMGDSHEERIEEYISIINRANFRLMRISDNLVFLGDMKDKSMLLCASNTDIDDFCRELTDRVAQLAKTLGVKFTFEGIGERLIIGIDRQKIERMLLHLISNSLAHTKAGGEVVLRVKKSQNQVILTVRDNGEGISPGAYGRLFSGIQDIDFDAVAQGKSGMGIGLYIVRMIAELHGGRIMLTDAEDGGVSVSVSLPARPIDEYNLKNQDYAYSSGYAIELVELSVVLPHDTYSAKRLEE